MNHYIRKQVETEAAGNMGMVAVLWTLRSVLALTILAEVEAGDLLYAGEALLALALCSLPGVLLKVDGGPSPIDIEILLLMAVGNCTLGVAGNLYRSLPYYDKFLHVANPLALAFYGVLLLASNLDSGSGKLSVAALVAFAVLAVTGSSAIWELLEYASDQLFHSTTQGSPTMGPLDDTMWDLLLSLLGALAGAVAATLSAGRRLELASLAHEKRPSSFC